MFTLYLHKNHTELLINSLFLLCQDLSVACYRNLISNRMKVLQISRFNLEKPKFASVRQLLPFEAIDATRVSQWGLAAFTAHVEMLLRIYCCQGKRGRGVRQSRLRGCTSWFSTPRQRPSISIQPLKLTIPPFLTAVRMMNREDRWVLSPALGLTAGILGMQQPCHPLLRNQSGLCT